MNEFLNKVGAAARTAADAVGTELNIASHEQRVRNAYRDLGKLYYNYVSSGMQPEGDGFDEKMAVIEAELKKIKELRAQRSAK